MTEEDQKPIYIFLDFQERLRNDLCESKVFFRIVNLNTATPLVQVNDSVYQGKYEESLGTNLFFRENTQTLPIFPPFEKQAPLSLSHAVSQTKILNLEQMDLVAQKVEIPDAANCINLNLKDDYLTILKRLEENTLTLESLTIHDKETKDKDVEGADGESLDNMETDQPSSSHSKGGNQIEVNELELKYAQLQTLARIPARYDVPFEPCAECDDKYKEAYEYHNLECQVLKPSPFFLAASYATFPEDALENAVDIDRSVFYGVTPPITGGLNALTNIQKQRIFSLENFDNLSLQSRHFVIKNQIENLVDYLSNASEQAASVKDEYGRTPVQTLEIYKKLCNALACKLEERETETDDDN